MIPLITLIFLAVALGFVDTDAATQLPRVSNCSIDIKSIDPNYLRHSVKVYTGVFVAVLSVAFIYQVLGIAIRFLNIGFINQYKKFFFRLVRQLTIYINILSRAQFNIIG